MNACPQLSSSNEPIRVVFITFRVIFLSAEVPHNWTVVNNKINMYNIHQYNSAVRMQQQQRDEEERYAKYLLKHGDFKEQAAERQKEKLESFLNEQIQAQKPFIFEDDHHKHWRPLKQYRDIEDRTKFLDFKTFRHKPHYEMDKIFNERERKEIQELSMRKEHLVKSNIIPEAQRSRSLRCQGPLNPKIEFRQTKKDQQYLQPRLRFTNITDRERMNETSMTYDDKFHSLYKSFEMTKSKLGRTTVSPRRERYENGKDTLDHMQQTHSQMAKSKTFYFEREASGEPPCQPEDSPPLSDENKMSPEISQRSGNGGKTRTYFKLAKTMQLLGKEPKQKETIELLMKRSQFERKKDLTNIVNNLHGQNYFKSPIL